MAPTLSPRGLRQVEIYSAVNEILTQLAQTRLQRTMTTVHALGRVWAAHPAGPFPFPSQELLAAMAGRSVRTVRRHLAELEAAGLLRVFRNRPARDAGGRWTRRTNRYLLLTYVARGRNRRLRRSRLGDTSDPLPRKSGPESAPPLWFDPPTATGPPIDRARVADLRAQLARR